MKAKLVAVIAALLLMTGCQQEQNIENTPQTEVQIDNKSNSENVADNVKTNEIEQTTDQTAEETINKIDNNENEVDDESQNKGSENGKNGSENPDAQISQNGQDSKENNVKTDVAHESDYLDKSVHQPDVEDIEIKIILGNIPGIDIEAGILEGCQILSQMHTRLNDESLEIMEFKGLYDTYWVQNAPYDSLESIRETLGGYFTENVVTDIIKTWGLIEYDGKLLAPELSESMGYDPESLKLTVAEVEHHNDVRYINMGFTNVYSESQSSLLRLNKSINETWKLDTIPGKGIIKDINGRFVKDCFWTEHNTTWNWPEFISFEDKIWNKVLIPVQNELRELVIEETEEFDSKVAFKALGIDQLTYWITWEYREQNTLYPSVDVVLSEYIKYGIHPNHRRKTVTLSKKTNEIITLEDVFEDEVAFMDEANVFIDRYMKENKEGFYSEAVFEGINGKTQFYIAEDGIVFYFQLYEYAPYAFGYPEIKVPFTNLKESLKAEFLSFVVETE